MPAKCSEDWNGRTLTQDVSGQWTAARVWCSIDALNENEALAATPEPGNDPIPNIGTSHPQNALLKVKSRSPVTDGGPQTWKVTVQYWIPSLTGPNNPDIDPLLRPWRAQWGRGQITLAVDLDVNAHKIVNSAGDVFDPPPTRTFETRSLTIIRYEPYYNLPKDDLYANAINSNRFTFGPVGQQQSAVEAGECLCTGVLPTSEFEFTVTAVEIGYNFEIIRDLKNGNVRLKPYSLYLKDQGRRGWYTDSGTKIGELYYADGTQVTQDVPLDGTGRPIDQTIKVTQGLKTPVSAPSNVGNGLNPEQFSTANAKYFGFEMLRSVDFSNILT